MHKLVSAGLVLLAATHSVCAQMAPASAADRLVVAEVIVQGSEKIATPTVLTYVKTRPGGDYNPDIVQEDTRNLIGSKLFVDVRVQVATVGKQRVNVYFLLCDLPNEIAKVEYRGAKHFTDDELQGMTRLHRGAPLNPTDNKLACQKIIRAYYNKGRPFADCYLIHGNRPSDHDVIFQITEGPQVAISDLRFTGNTFVGGDVLATHIQSSKQVLGFGGDFNRELIEADAGKLREYYMQFGYHDVQISYAVQMQPDGRHVALVFHIREGTRYRLQETPTVVGSLRIPRKEDLEAVLQFKSRDWYDGRKIKRGEQEIRDWYGFQGFDVRVQAVPYFSNEQPGFVLVRYEVDDRNSAPQ